jgi:hypothetical protein
MVMRWVVVGFLIEGTEKSLKWMIMHRVMSNEEQMLIGKCLHE